MKKFVVIFAVFLFTFGLAVPCLADSDSAATSHVFVKVVENIAVRSLAAVVSAGEIQTGAFSATLPFRLDANSESVILGVAASSLYKGDDPLAPTVGPIGLFDGVKIEPTDASPLAGGSNVAQYQTPGEVVGGFPTLRTNDITFESSQNNHFSQNVAVTVSWFQNDAEKPTGEYSGVVKLYAMIP